MTISEALTAEQQRQGVSIYELAKRSGMSVGRVHGILTGTTPNPGVLTAAKLLTAMGKNLAWLEKQTR